jgi:hypothetical protein
LLDELITSLRSEGIYECIGENSRKLESYVVSAANPRGALRRLKDAGW